MIRLALVVLLAACNGARDDSGNDDTGFDVDRDGDGYSGNEGDCDDSDETINPDATEIYYDGVDQNCDDKSDDDADEDGEDAEAEGGDDCDDTDAAINPDADEIFYDSIDQNCDGGSDFDKDGDGYDSAQHGGGDCDDDLAAVHPNAGELCSTAYDDDCEGGINEQDATDAPTWYLDFDEDTFGSLDETTAGCSQPSGYVANDDDCNDEEGTVNPDAADVACDGFDNDCDPLTFEPAAVLVDGAPAGNDLAAVMDDVSDGQVVTICEGKLVASYVSIEDQITLQGIGDPAVTILEPPVIDADPNPSATFMFGAPLLKVSTTDAVVIKNLTLSKSAGWPEGDDVNGGGLYVSTLSDVTLIDVVISGNRSGWGSGIYAAADSDLTLTRVTIADNIGQDTIGLVYAKGGGLYLEEGVSVVAEDLVVDGNEAVLGGGIYANEDVSIVATGDSVVSANDAELDGGGLSLVDGCSVDGLTIAGNFSSVGAGVVAHESSVTPGIVTLTHVTLVNNRAELHGGGMRATGEVELDSVVMDGNGARYGGNVSLVSATTHLKMTGGAVRNGLLTGSLHDGGGAYVSDATIESVGVDWGVGADDNTREDLWLDAGFGGGGVACSYGSNASFIIVDQANVTCPPSP